MKKQINPDIKASLLRGGVYLILLSAVCAVPLALAAVAPLFQHAETGKSTQSIHPTATSEMIQFTSSGHVLGFAKNGVYVASGSHALRVEFVNARITDPISAAARSEAKSDKRAMPLSQVSYPNLWNGVTLMYDAPKGAIARSTYRLEAHTNAENIRLRYNAPVAVQRDGSLLIRFQTGALSESAPKAWQERDGKHAPVQIAFASRGEHEVGFAVGQYDRSQPLFIDPTLTTLTWNTFLGSSDSDTGNGIAVDGSGNVYVAGISYASWGTPIRAFTSRSSDCGNTYDSNAFVGKLDSSGNLIWNTFLGGSCTNEGNGIAADGFGNVYVTGWSDRSWGSPVQDVCGVGINGNAFAAELDSSGNLIWNTFLCSSDVVYNFFDFGNGVAVDRRGNVYVVGGSNATWGSPIRAFSGDPSGGNAFAAKLNSSGSLIWNTFLGGSIGGTDYGYTVAVDRRFNVYVAGVSTGTWGSPVRAFSGGAGDAWAAKLASTGNLLWNTFLGGSGADEGNGIAVDGSGNVYVVGYSTDATWGRPVRAFTCCTDAFAAKLSSRGRLIWNTFLGGGGDSGQGIAVDGSANVYVAGGGNETWGTPDRAYSASTDAWAAKLASTGNLLWNTFLGGDGTDFGSGIAVDGSSNVYVTGTSGATWESPVRAYSDSNDAFAVKISQ